MTRISPAWNEIISTSNTEQIWKELNRVVCQHKLSRYSGKYDLLIDQGSRLRYTDLTQELFLTLLDKDRFNHYLEAEMSDHDIEIEISQIELTNILTQDLRRRYPESYRISRRILQVLQSKDVFKRFAIKPHERVADHVYGLLGWSEDREVKYLLDVENDVAEVPYYNRDIRHAGCAGDSQIIISNDDLHILILRVLTAADCFLTVKQIRHFVMSRLTIMDIHLTPVESYVDEDNKQTLELPDTRATPEQLLTNSIMEEIAETIVDSFLNKLFIAVKEKEKQFKLAKNILRLFYLEPDLTQWDVSRKLGVSDSLISGYRKTIDSLLMELDFSTIEEGKKFKAKLKEKLGEFISEE